MDHSGTDAMEMEEINLAVGEGRLALGDHRAQLVIGLQLRLCLADGTCATGRFADRGHAPAALEMSDPRLRCAVHVARSHGAAVAELHYEGSPLAAERAVELSISLPGYARGMALRRRKLFWTAPLFASDPLLLPPDNLLLLWPHPLLVLRSVGVGVEMARPAILCRLEQLDQEEHRLEAL